MDAADVLPDGRRFQNIDEYKQLLLKDKDQLARALAEKLLTYAHGRRARRRPTSRRSRRSSRNIRGKNYGFRSLVHEIVQSKVFQSK